MIGYDIDFESMMFIFMIDDEIRCQILYLPIKQLNQLEFTVFFKDFLGQFMKKQYRENRLFVGFIYTKKVDKIDSWIILHWSGINKHFHF